MFEENRSWPMVRATVVIGTAVALLGACATQRQLVAQAVDSNNAVAEFESKLLLLNVVRAAYRQPMVFTDIDKISGSSGPNQLSGGVTVPFGRATTSPFQVTSGLQGNYPSMDQVVLDKQEFTRGMRTPVTPETLKYLLTQGWSYDILFNLLVDRIRTKNQTYINYPGDEDSYGAWTNLVSNIVSVELNRADAVVVEAKDVDLKDAASMPDGFEVSQLKVGTESPTGISALDMVRKKVVLNGALSALEVCEESQTNAEVGLDSVATSETSRKEGGRPEQVSKAGEQRVGQLKVGVGSESAIAAASELPHVVLKKRQLLMKILIIVDMKTSLPGNTPRSAEKCLSTTVLRFDTEDVVLRSPEAILYHLGEIVRLDTGAPWFSGTKKRIGDAPLISDRWVKCDGQMRAPLFVVDHRRPGVLVPLFVVHDEPPVAARHPLTVEVMGKKYWIAQSDEASSCGEREGAQSMHVLSLVQMLLNSQKNVAEMPTTESVRLLR